MPQAIVHGERAPVREPPWCGWCMILSIMTEGWTPAATKTGNRCCNCRRAGCEPDLVGVSRRVWTARCSRWRRACRVEHVSQGGQRGRRRSGPGRCRAARARRSALRERSQPDGDQRQEVDGHRRAGGADSPDQAGYRRRRVANRHCPHHCLHRLGQSAGPRPRLGRWSATGLLRTSHRAPCWT